MGRPRTGVVPGGVFGGGAVYVKKHPSRAGFKVCYTAADGRSREDFRKDLDNALQWAADVGLRVGVLSGSDPVWALIHHMLEVEVPADWSKSYVNQQKSFARTWLEPLLLKACNDLRQEDLEAVIARLRVAGRSTETERQVRSFLERLVEHGKRWKFLPPGADFEIRTAPRSTDRVRMVGDDRERIYREDLPKWDSLFKQAKAAAELTGVWWEELRILVLCGVGPRWGEHCLWRPEDFGLFGLTEGLEPLDVRVFGKVDELDYCRFVEDRYGTKNRTRRVTAHQTAFEEMLWQRYAEVGPGGIMFPATYGQNPACLKAGKHVCGTPAPVAWSGEDEGWPCYASRSAWRQQVFLKSGLAVGWAVKAYRKPEVGQKADPRPSSLVWTEHDYRHLAATMLLDPKGTEWWHGGGLSLPDVAYALGDRIETTQRTYIGKSEFSRARIRTAMG